MLDISMPTPNLQPFSQSPTNYRNFIFANTVKTTITYKDMRKLIAIIGVLSIIFPAQAQKTQFTTYFDTTYWFSDDVDSLEIEEEGLKLDTMPGNRYGKYSQFALSYVNNIIGTKVGDGLCGRVGERMCELSHSQMTLKGRVTTDMSILEVGDIIIFPQFLEFIGETGLPYASTPAEHLAMFLGMKNDSTIIIAHQNTENRTYYTKVVIWEVNIKALRFFKGNNHTPYFSVYGYEPRKVLKKEYAFLSGN